MSTCIQCGGEATMGMYCAGCASGNLVPENTAPVTLPAITDKPFWQDTSWEQTQPDVKSYEEAFQSQFNETPEISALWSLAATGHGYERAREAFWELISDPDKIFTLIEKHRSTNDNPLGPEQERLIAEKLVQASEFVRNMLAAAGYELGDSKAPRLEMKWDDQKQSRIDATRTLSIDHATPQSRRPDLATEPANLRFMQANDNSSRGARWDENDRRYVPESPDKSMSLQERRDREEFRSRVEEMLRAREREKSGGPMCLQCGSNRAVVGSLCQSCYQSTLERT